MYTGPNTSSAADGWHQQPPQQTCQHASESAPNAHIFDYYGLALNTRKRCQHKRTFDPVGALAPWHLAGYSSLASRKQRFVNMARCVVLSPFHFFDLAPKSRVMAVPSWAH